jgi:hypothetical protein
MPENNFNNNEELEKQRERFLKELEMKEKMLDEELNQTKKTSNEQVHLPYINQTQNNNTDNNIEAQKKRFLEDLDKKEKELNRTIEYNNSLAGSNLSRKKQSSQQLMKYKFYRTIIGSIVLVIAVVFIFRGLMSTSYQDVVSTTTEHNINQVKIALINYHDDYGVLPIDSNSKININELLKKQYLGTDVESMCNCSFYLKDDKQTVLAIPNSK